MISCKSSLESKNRFISLMAFNALLDFLRAEAIWGPHCSLESKIIPRTFICDFDWTSCLETEILTGSKLDLENRQISVLASLTFNPELVTSHIF